MEGKGRERRVRGPAWVSLLIGAAVLAAALAPAARGAILDPLHAFSDEPGWSGSLEGSWSATGGNTDLSALHAAARVQLLSARQRWRLLGAADRQTSRGELAARSVSAHLRHNLHLAGPLSTLSFLQWQENPFQRLRARYLVGAGLRVGLHGDGFPPPRAPAAPSPAGEARRGWRAAAGAADMLELEDLQGRPSRTWHRLSTFLDLQVRPRAGVLLQGTAFLQPRWQRPADYRLLVSGGLQVELVGNLSQFTRVRWERDAAPPPGVDPDDWQVTTGLALEL